MVVVGYWVWKLHWLWRSHETRGTRYGETSLQCIFSDYIITKTVMNNFVWNLHLICFKTTFEDVGLLMRFSDHWRPWKAYFSIFLEIVIFFIVSLPLIQIPFWVFFYIWWKFLKASFLDNLVEKHWITNILPPNFL